MPFKPGRSGNPAGRPKKGLTLTDALNELMEVKTIIQLTEDSEPLVVLKKEAIAMKLVALAEAGDMTAIKYVFDRIDGAPTVTNKIIQEDIPQIIIARREHDAKPV